MSSTPWIALARTNSRTAWDGRIPVPDGLAASTNSSSSEINTLARSLMLSPRRLRQNDTSYAGQAAAFNSPSHAETKCHPRTVDAILTDCKIWLNPFSPAASPGQFQCESRKLHAAQPPVSLDLRITLLARCLEMPTFSLRWQRRRGHQKAKNMSAWVEMITDEDASEELL